MSISSFYFLTFCILLALRDALTQLMFQKDAGAIDPVLMLFVYCWVATSLALLFHSLRKGFFNPISKWRGYSSKQQRTFAKLGLATWLVYAATIWGIYLIGAPVFNVIDYAAMPLITVFAGALLLSERIVLRRVVLGLLGVLGVFLIFLGHPAYQADQTGWTWPIGILLAGTSTLATSYCTALQKQQVDDGLHPDEVLLFRFPLAALLMTIWLFVIAGRIDFQLRAILTLAVIGAVGLFLPLLLLCFGFIRASLGQFSRFLFLIPVLTWIVVPILIRGEVSRISDWRIAVGAIILLGSYVTSEIVEDRLARSGDAESRGD